jgi:hypothetical protein
MKIRPLRAELFHAYRQTDGRTNVTKLIVAFRNFANSAKKKTWNNLEKEEFGE